MGEVEIIEAALCCDCFLAFLNGEGISSFFFLGDCKRFKDHA